MRMSTHISDPILRALALGSLMLVGCVTGTTYQRAMRFQGSTPESGDIIEGLLDPSWKVRYLAANACGRANSSECMPVLARLAAGDASTEVRATSRDSLSTRCNDGGREAIAALVAAATTKETLADYPPLVAKCPSADSVALLGISRLAPRVLPQISQEIPREIDQRLEWLRLVSSLPPPSKVVGPMLAEAATEKAKSDALKRARLSKAEDVAGRAREALAREDIATARLLTGEARELGYDTTAIEEATQRLVDARIAGHVKQAWLFVKRDDPDKALREYEQATALGGTDDALSLAIARRTAQHEWSEQGSALSLSEVEGFVSRHGDAAPPEAWKRLSQLRSRSIEHFLPVYIGDEWSSVRSRLVDAGIRCEDSKRSFGMEVMWCSGPRLDLPGLTTSSIRFESHAGIALTSITINGKTRTNGCSKLMSSARDFLSSQWTFRPIRKDGPTLVLDGSMPGDLQLSISCGDKRTGGMTLVSLTDAWLSLPTRTKSFWGGYARAGNVLWDRLSSAITAGEVLKAPTYQQAEIIPMVYREVASGLLDAEVASSELSPRSERAFSLYKSTVLNETWFSTEYMRAWYEKKDTD